MCCGKQVLVVIDKNEVVLFDQAMNISSFKLFIVVLSRSGENTSSFYGPRGM